MSIAVLVSNVRQVCQYAFAHLEHLLSVNISNNPIRGISDKAFYNLPGLKELSLLNISLSETTYHIFAHINIMVLETNVSFLCCLLPSGAHCSAVIPKYISCVHLLQNQSIQIVCIIMSFFVCVLNALSLYYHHTTEPPDSGTKNTETFRLLVSFLNVADMSLSPPLIILWAADLTFQKSFVLKQEMWQSSTPCFLIFGLLHFSTLLTILSSNFMAFSRLMVVKYPLETKFKETNFLRRNISLCSAAAFSVSTTLLFVKWFLRLEQLSALCTFFCDPTKENIFSHTVTGCSVALYVVSIIAFLVNSVHLLISLKKSQQKVQHASSKKASNKAILTQIVILNTSNILCWGATSGIFVSSLLLSSYPTLMMFWVTAAVLPLTSVINPTVFLVLLIRKSLKS